ncbi:MAG: DNA internalization-related competence protein ComEC/Rec2 [Candidatus Thiodiazotropha sp.]
MNRILLAFVAGTALFQLSPILPDGAWALLCLPLTLLWRIKGMRPVVAFVAGLCWSLLFATWQLGHRLPGELEGRDLLLEGEVDSLPVHRDGMVRFELKVSELTDSAGEVAALDRVRLNWYGAPQELEPGQIWRLKVRLKRPRGMHNPAGFDYEQWLFVQGIGATGYVRKWRGSRLLGQGMGLKGLRHAIAERIDNHLEAGPSSGLIKALSLGDRRALDRQAWQVFSRTGTSHLIAISGLHVGLVAGWLWFIGQWGWRRSDALTLRFPAQRAGAVLGLLGALGYAALAGFSLPTQRALVMLAVALGGVTFARSVQPARTLSLALFLVMLLDPPASLSAGFWLSFGAVGLILLVIGGRLRLHGKWSQLLRVQVAISLGLMPLLLLHFGQASLIAPLVNLLLVPWFALVLVPMSLLGLLLLPLPLMAQGWYSLLELLAGGTFSLLQLLSQLPLATVQLAHLPPWLSLAALLGGLLMLLPGGIPTRSIGLLLLAPILFAEPSRPRPGEFWFTLLDVGQGLACVVETAGHVMLYDTGPAYASGFSAAEAAVLPFLASRAHDRIDRMVVSNGDRDHAGGVEAIQASLPVDDLLSGEPDRQSKARPCLAGEHWSWEGVEFRLLHPASSAGFAKSNDRSCVVQVSNGHWSLLLTGDIESEGEHSLLAAAADGLASDILVAPHHGSATSSSEAFVKAVDPEWVLFSTGYRNRYGFPRQPVVERWRRAGALLINSAEAGAVSFHLRNDGESPSPVRQREQGRRYWNE